MHKAPFQSIFVADDDEDDLYLLRFAFQQNLPQCHLEIASDGEALIKLLKKANTRPCLIILDLNMPVMDGFEVLQWLRANPAYKQTPIVVLTTSQNESDRHRALTLGANAFITKPTSLAILGQTLYQLDKDWQLDQCF